MDIAMLIAASTATAGNILVLKVKIEKERYSDALLDGIIFIALGFAFMGTITGLQIAVIASAIVSLYLWFFPPKEFFGNFVSKTIDTKKPKKKIKFNNY